MVKKITYCVSLLLLVALMSDCTSEKEIDLNLPHYDNTPVIECYLEPGKPYRLLAYYSVSYFDTPQLVPVKNASISIQVEGQTINLVYDTIPRIGETKLYNYRSTDLVPFAYDKTFSLQATIDNVNYSAVTTIPQPIPIDSIIPNCNDEMRCQVSIRFTDPVNEVNFYRYLCISDSIGGDVKQDFVLNDELFEDGKAGFGGGFSFNEGQKVIVKFFHINKDYYDFLTSVNSAQGANGNPFAQPSSIKSNIPGMLGIFAGLSYEEEDFPVQ